MPPAKGKRPKPTTKHNKVSVPKRRKVEPPPNDLDAEDSGDEAVEQDDDPIDPFMEVMTGFNKQPFTIWHVAPLKNFDYYDRKFRSMAKRLEQELRLLASTFTVHVSVLPGIATANDHEALMIDIRENVLLSKKGRNLTCILGSSGLKHKPTQLSLPIMIARGKQSLVKSIDSVFRTFYGSMLSPLGLDRFSTAKKLSTYWLYNMMRFGDANADEAIFVFHGKIRADQVSVTLPASYLTGLSTNLKKVKLQNVWTLIIDAMQKLNALDFDSSIGIVSIKTPKFYVSIPKYGYSTVKISISNLEDAQYIWSALTHLSAKLSSKNSQL